MDIVGRRQRQEEASRAPSQSHTQRGGGTEDNGRWAGAERGKLTSLTHTYRKGGEGGGE